MPISLDKALGLNPLILRLTEQRSTLLASNLSNAATPGYKARDLDFQYELRRQAGLQGEVLPLLRTQAGHLSADSSGDEATVQYRIPLSPNLDGNTVDEELDRARFAENAFRYEAALTFLNRKFSGLKGALRGE